MALAETANLVVKLSLGGNFTSQIGRATAGLGKLEKGSTRAYRAGQQIGTGIKRGAILAAAGVGILATQVAAGLDSLIKLEQAQAQTGAVLKSTKQAAGVTGAEVTRLSEKYEALNATIGDEFVRAGQNMLLTFTEIRGKAFEPALAAVLDMNTAMGKGPEGLTKTAILVGKALNDPTKGLTALTRVGVAFSKEQVKRIKALQKEGKTYEAQKIILAELNKEFGGSFLAQGNTTAGKVAKFGDAIEDLQRSLAVALLPTVSNVADALTKLLADPATIKGAEDIGKAIAGVFSKENLATGAKAVGDAFGVLRDNLPAIKSGLQGVGSIIGAAVSAFRSLPPEIQSLAVAGFAVNKITGGLVTNVAGGLIGAVLGQLKAAVVRVHGGVVTVSGGVGAGGAVPAGKGGGIGRVASAAAKVFIVGAAVGVFAELLGVLNEQSGQNKQQATALGGKTATFIAGASPQALRTSLAGIDARIADLNSGFGPDKLAFQLNIDGVRDAVLKTRSDLVSALVGPLDEMRREATSTRATQAASAGLIVSAIYASRPIITVNVSPTTMTKVTQVSGRYGPPLGSRNQGNGTTPHR